MSSPTVCCNPHYAIWVRDPMTGLARLAPTERGKVTANRLAAIKGMLTGQTGCQFPADHQHHERSLAAAQQQLEQIRNTQAMSKRVSFGGPNSDVDRQHTPPMALSREGDSWLLEVGLTDTKLDNVAAFKINIGHVIAKLLGSAEDLPDLTAEQEQRLAALLDERLDKALRRQRQELAQLLAPELGCGYCSD